MSTLINSRQLEAEPWRRLPPELAPTLERELGQATAEILAAIGREVPAYARPLEGAFGRGVRRGVGAALGEFVALVHDPAAGREQGRDVYRALGRGELRAGRSLDALQRAYRVGARVAWRRFAAAAREAGFDAAVLSLLAESVFAYIDELSADSVEGYAGAQSEREGERARRRQALVALIVAEPPSDEGEVAAAAAEAGWRMPATVAALACRPDELARIGGRLAVEVLPAPVGGFGCVLIPDPTGPGRLEEARRASAGLSAALGPPEPMDAAGRSWRLARLALAATEAGAVPGDGLVVADDHLLELVAIEAPATLERIAARRLAPLAGLSPKARARMAATALAFVRERGVAPAMARAMGVHPQTARYRLARLRELYGDALDDPEARLELELALRRQGRRPTG
jgi:PucR C-terminal helix-turn-helix domain